MKRLVCRVLSFCLVALSGGVIPIAAAQVVPFEADVTFPSAGDTIQLATASRVKAAGDSFTGTRTVALAGIDDLDATLVLGENHLGDGCELLLDLAINGTPVGTLTVQPGELQVGQFLAAAERILPTDGSKYTFALTVAEDLSAECGYVTLPNGKSKWHLELEDGEGGNARPRGAAGGPYEVAEGASVTLAATGSDPEGAALTFSWDFDGDGEHDDALGATPVFSAASLDGPLEQALSLRIADADGASRVLQTKVTVKNVAPAFDESVVPAAIGYQEVKYSFQPRVIEPCLADVLTYTLIEKPSGMVVGANGLVEWTPTEAMVGNTYSIKLKVADDNSGSDELVWSVRVVADPDTPTANAGADRDANPGCAEITCQGTSPRDADLVYQWRLVRGPAPVVFSAATEATTNVVLTVAGNYTFSCTVTEAEGEEPLVSPPDELVITVANLPPIADPGFGAYGKTANRITLDGRRSIDPNGDAMRYRWEQTAGESVRSSGYTNAITSFYPLTTDIYCFTLTVQDAGGLESPPAEICIPVNEPGDPETCEENADCRQARCVAVAGEEFRRCQPFTSPDYNPVAWAGEDLRALAGTEVRLQGMRSYDPAGQQAILEEYVWAPCSPLAGNVVLDGQGTMMPVFTPDVPGRYCFSLVVRDADGHRSLPDEVQVLVEAADNRAPLADAGPGAAAQPGDQVTLDASASRDPDGEDITVQWTQVRGPAVALDDPTSLTPSFCAVIPGIYQFRLEAMDERKLAGLPAETWVTVSSSCNQAPVAKAGVDFGMLTDDDDPDTLTDRGVLDGRQTFDPDPSPHLDQLADGLKFQWVQTGGLPVDLQLPFTRRPWFQTKKWGVYTFRLFVLVAWPEDDDSPPAEACWQAAWSLPDDVTVVVDDRVGAEGGNAVPVADAGFDFDCLVGEECALDGLGSRDADGDPLTYRWELVGGPFLELTGLATASPTFSAQDLGEWIFRLTVNDGYVDSLPDEVRVRVRANDNEAPVCHAGRDVTVTEGDTVTLNGCSSTDRNGDRLTFTWKQVEATPDPIPDFVQGEDVDACKATFPAPDVTTQTVFVFELVASDGRADCEPDRVSVTVEPPEPVCDPGETKTCYCANGDVGDMTCAADGSRYEPCTNCHTPLICRPGAENTNCACPGQVGYVGTCVCEEDGLAWGEVTDCRRVAGDEDEAGDDDGCATAGRGPVPGAGWGLLVGLTLLGLLVPCRRLRRS